MREVTSLINILFSFTIIIAFPFSDFGGFVKSFILSAYLIFLHLDALFGREDYFSSCLSWWGFCHFQLVSLLLTRFLLPIFTMGRHKRWFLFCLLVSLWTHFLVCVCGNDMSCTLYLISSRLCWWVMLILILVFSSALPWLTHITLVELILKLLPLHVAQPLVLCNWYAYCLIYLLALVVCFY